MEFEWSDTPHLPTYNLPLKKDGVITGYERILFPIMYIKDNGFKFLLFKGTFILIHDNVQSAVLTVRIRIMIRIKQI